MKRIMLKLSGEALAGSKKTGFDEETVRKVALQVKQLVDAGTEVGIVIGGGNFWRGRTSENIDRTKADQIGMLATVMNCIYVSEIFRSTGMQTNILTPFECGSFTKLFSKDRANKYFAKGMVVFFAGGTGHPYFSTDTGVVLSKLCPYGEHTVLLVKPPIAVSTPWVYKNLDLKNVTHPDVDKFINCIENKDYKKSYEYMGNVLESVTIKEYPIIAEIKNKMMELGASVSLMSGSGPTVFGIFENEQKAKDAAKIFKNDFKEVIVTKTV